MKQALTAILLPLICGSLRAQQPFTAQADSCFQYLAAGDTLHFNRLYPLIADAYEQDADPETYALRRQLLAMRNEDQSIRILVLEARKRFGSDSPVAQQAHARMKQIDRVNAERIRRILDAHGWPDKEEVGEEAAETAFLCIQHLDDAQVQQTYLPMLQQAVETGTATGWHLAFLVDRIRMNQGERQVYGTQTVSRNGKLDYVVPLETPEAVDSLPRSVALEPMNDYLDGKWDLEAYKRDLPAIEQKYKAFVASRKTTK